MSEITSGLAPNRNHTDKISIIFTIFIVLYPVLNRYKTPIPFLTLSEVIILVFFVIRLFQIHKEIKCIFTMIPFLSYILIRVITLITGIENGDTQTLGTTTRLLFIYAMSFFLLPEYFDKDFGYKFLRIAGYAIGIYGLLQLLFSRFGILLTQNIPFLSPYDDGTVQVAIEKNIYVYGLRYRSTSVLTEPAALCIYLLLPLSMVMSCEKMTTKNFIDSIFFSVCCITSISSTGIIVVFFLWGYYFIKNFRTYFNPKVFIPILFLLTIFIVIFINSSMYEYFLERTFKGDISNGLGKSTRFITIEETFDNSKTIMGILFGGGLLHKKNYLPGFARLYYGLGILGVLTFGLFIVSAYIEGNRKRRYAIITYVILNIGTEILFGNFAVYFMAFFFCSEDENEYKTISEKSDLGDIEYLQENNEQNIQEW